MKRQINRRMFVNHTINLGIGSAFFHWQNKMAFGSKGHNSPPLILSIHCDGGWDPTMVFDDKTESAIFTKEPGAYGVKASATSPGYCAHPQRPSVCQFFDKFGPLSTIINGMYSASMAHTEALMHSMGSPDPKTKRWVDWLTFASTILAPQLPLPHVSIDAPFMPGPYSRFGSKISRERLEGSKQTQKTTSESMADPLQNYLAWSYETKLASLKKQNLDDEKMAAITASFQRESIINQAIESCPLNPDDSIFLKSAKLALHLFKTGNSQCASLQMGADQSWKTGPQHFAIQSQQFESLFSDLLKILAQAKTLGLDDRLFIVVKSERGRSPKFQSHGKSIWPYTSALLVGHGINGGRTFGETDHFLIGQEIDPAQGTIGTGSPLTLKMSHIMAALYEKWGINPQILFDPAIKPALFLLAKSLTQPQSLKQEQSHATH
jgi:hypothetical protein